MPAPIDAQTFIDHPGIYYNGAAVKAATETEREGADYVIAVGTFELLDIRLHSFY